MSDSQGIARRSTRTVKPTFKMKELGLLSTVLDPDEDHLKTAGSRNGLKKNSRTEFRNHNKELLQNDTRNKLTLDDEKVCGSLNVGRKSNGPNNISVARNVPNKRLQLKNANITDGTGNVVHVIDPKAKNLVKTAEIEGSSISTTKTVCETANSGVAITSLDDSCIVETDKMIENVDKKRCSIGLGRHNKIQQAHDVADEKDDAESKCDDLTEQTIKVEELYDTESELDGPSTESLYCDICQKMLANKYIYKKHVAIHSGIKPFRCVICDARFPIREYLVSHMVCHTTDRKYKCDVCSATFFRQSNLSSHMISHTEVRQYQCEVCSKWFKTKAVRDEHMKYHGERRHVCDKCGKSFITATYLRKHVSVHEGIKPFKCEECGKSFPYQQSLQEHLMRHKGIKPVFCEVCGKGFNNLRQLKAHKKYHEAKTDFLCSLCNLYYDSIKSLKKHHYMSHATVYKCEHCDQTFKNKRVLVSHKFTAHREKLASRGRLHATKFSCDNKVECSLCKRTFYNEGVLSEHLVNQHGLDKEDAERVIQAKDIGQIVIINEEHCEVQKEDDVNDKEQYRVYYKDEEIDVYVTVRKGAEKEITDAEAREIVNAFKISSNASLGKTSGMAVEERGSNVKDLLLGSKTMKPLLEDNTEAPMQMKGVSTDENNSENRNKTKEASTDASKHVTRNSGVDVINKLQNLVNSQNSVYGNNGQSCYIVKKPDMVGTIKDNEELFVLVPNSKVANKESVSENMLQFQRVECDQIRDVYEEIVDSTASNNVGNVFGINAENGDKIVLIVNQDENVETYMVEGQEYLEVVESEMEIEESYGVVESDDVDDKHENLVTPNPDCSGKHVYRDDVHNFRSHLVTPNPNSSCGQYNINNNNEALRYENSQVNANIPRQNTASRNLVSDSNSEMFSNKGNIRSVPTSERSVYTRPHEAFVANGETNYSRLSNNSSKPDEFLLTVPDSNFPGEIAQFENALRRKALQFESFKEYGNFLDNMMLALQKAKVEQSIIFGTQRP
ncbi:uncharacterized protein LOC127843061 [Dreissena polymorpha]|uniref:C2H2-type domain-containing protein n=1 Tax=Dreissena polymorpha TaxID=45954 RepID=A0A9D4IR51_DREPO|nr:uncharacterized protein LOC127843061 [Dreissena polymorpha]KAH3780918.1 hypothetical protein DPMN_158743 [Dreissena polymorpha]